MRRADHPARAGSPGLLACGAALLALLCGCSDDPAAPPLPGPSVPYQTGSPWPKFRGNARQDGRSHVLPSTSGGALWDIQTDKGIFSSPVVGADGTIYIGSADRIFYAIEPDGGIAWQVLTGEIIDSAALLDDRGRVYFGSGDGKLRALDARTGDPIWTMEADDPSVNGAFINWFEGNVAMGPSGTLYVPNDNFFVYAIDRDSGEVVWRFEMPDQTWSLPAVDVATGNLYIGNNNAVALLGDNTYIIDAQGNALWSTSTMGTIAASPMLTPDGMMVLGGFDGFVRAYDPSGEIVWEFGARDHIYASPAQLPDGTIIQPAADGTVYALEPHSGTLVWAFDTREPVRSSPAIDGEGNIYLGSGEGKLFVLGPDGELRWAMQLITEARNDLNSSPALGAEAIYLAGESGQIFSVPYDYCLRPQDESDDRCIGSGGEDLPESGVHLLYTSRLGALEDELPDPIDPNQALTFSLVVREGGDTVLALIDSSSVEVEVDPATEVELTVTGDRRFVTLTPTIGWQADVGGEVSLTVTGDYLVDPDRSGLAMSGGTKGGDIDVSFSTAVREAQSGDFPLPIPTEPGDAAAVWELSRLALPTPTIMPSYNQIGFDSLHYLIGLVELDEASGHGVAWMAGAKLAEDENETVIDPATKALLPLQVDHQDGSLTLLNEQGLSVEVMSATLPLRTFRLAATLDASGSAAELAGATGATICAEVPMYGTFLQLLGLCNPQTDELSVAGGALLTAYQGGSQQAPSSLGQVSFAVDASAATASLTGSSLALDEHVFGLLLLDAASGAPLELDYGLETERTSSGAGIIESVSVPLDELSLPESVRAYLMVDTYPAAVETLTP